MDQIYDRFQIDVVPASAKYIGPELKKQINEKGEIVEKTYWGFERTLHSTSIDTYGTTSYFPLDNVKTVKEVEAYTFPNPDWFDYSTITETCSKYEDKAIIVGHEGPFQMVTNLISMDKFFMMMYDDQDVAKAILRKMNEFELEYYKRIFEAGKGKVDILRPHDDYGTQISLLFSVDMWREFFKDNTKKLVNVAHRYNAFYQQHSCGAIRPLIPEFIECGVDILEPIQKVSGLEPENLKTEFDCKITFHGGIDTQNLLPNGTQDMVQKETEKFIHLLGENGCYILMASQAFEGDVPIENIEAIYNVDRNWK